MRQLRTLALFTLALALVAPVARASTVTGVAAGALLPEGELSEFNDPSYFISSRSIFADKMFGGRASAYYGDTTGKDGAAGGRVYGFDIAALLQFGSQSTFGYVYAGAGYGNLTFTMPLKTPGFVQRTSSHDWCWTGGIGISIKKHVYIEASYVSYQTDPTTTDYIPVVIGFEF
jgi:hypothetical protein